MHIDPWAAGIEGVAIAAAVVCLVLVVQVVKIRKRQGRNR